jgi:hypothetical protein
MQRRDTCVLLQLDTSWRQDRRDGHKVLLLDVRITQRQLERRQLPLVYADASREEERLGDGNIELEPQNAGF